MARKCRAFFTQAQGNITVLSCKLDFHFVKAFTNLIHEEKNSSGLGRLIEEMG